MWRERRLFAEYREVREHPVWTGAGMPEGQGRPAVLLGGWMASPRSIGAIERLVDETGAPVTLIGHSRGGQYARVMAVRHPELVAGVVTVSAPVRIRYPPFLVVNAPANAFDFLVRRGLLGPVDEELEARVDRDQIAPFPTDVPYVSIWSRTDGLVDWRFCLDPAAHDLEVDATHLGICNSIEGITAVGEALRLIDDGRIS